jgi:hypothetical protein
MLQGIYPDSIEDSMSKDKLQEASLLKIRIPRSLRRPVLNELKKKNIRWETLFPRSTGDTCKRIEEELLSDLADLAKTCG